MAEAYPPEFRHDVVRVARKHHSPINQIAKDLGISEATLHNWLKQADVEDGVRPGSMKPNEVSRATTDSSTQWDVWSPRATTQS